MPSDGDAIQAQISKEFFDRVNKAIALLLDSKGTIRVISHYDSDGINAAGIICNALLRKGRNFHASLVRLDTNFFKRLGAESNKFTIFSDMGSAQIEKIEKLGGKVIIIDHHPPLRDTEKAVLINTHLFGINGAYDASASTASFVFALMLDEKNWDLCAYALAGCIGDKQYPGSPGSLNKTILDGALKRGFIEKRIGLNFNAGRIGDALTDSIDPFFKGISGRKKEVKKLLAQINIDVNTNMSELNDEQLSALHSILVLRLLKQGMRVETAEQLVMERYWIPEKGMFAEELSDIIDACGRMNQSGMGLSLCLGHRESMRNAKKLQDEYKKIVRKGLMRIEKEGVFSKKNIQFFYTEESSTAGVQAGIAMQYLLDQEKPVFVMTAKNKKTSISARGTKYLVKKGLDLGIVCRTAARSIGGTGGGHTIASGATIPKGKEKVFIEKADEIVSEQMKGNDK